jgi:hypothetical protein
LIQDFGTGKGKIWRADETGFIHDESWRIANITAQEAEWMGLTPKRNKRLPPRVYKKFQGDPDPEQTVDPPLPFPPQSTVVVENGETMTASIKYVTADSPAPTVMPREIRPQTTALDAMTSPAASSTSITSSLLPSAQAVAVRHSRDGNHAAVRRAKPADIIPPAVVGGVGGAVVALAGPRKYMQAKGKLALTSKPNSSRAVDMMIFQ